MTVLAFNNDPRCAADIIAQVADHHIRDEIVQGVYWQNGKGCFIGCISHSHHSDNALITANLLGWPHAAVRIAEHIFETLPNTSAKDFPLALVRAPAVGADLTTLHWKFLFDIMATAMADSEDEGVAGLMATTIGLLARKVARQDVPRKMIQAEIKSIESVVYVNEDMHSLAAATIESLRAMLIEGETTIGTQIIDVIYSLGDGDFEAPDAEVMAATFLRILKERTV